MILIGISGKARSGKDTLGDYLLKEFEDYWAIKTAYAVELKSQVAEHFDLSHDQLYGDLKEVQDRRYPIVKHRVEGLDFAIGHERYWTPREILQAYGQFMREVDYDYWVKALFKEITRQKPDVAIITDLRHINEVNAVLDKGGVHVRIYRDSEEYERVHGQQHISETALDDYGHIDFKVTNDWTLKELKVAAVDLAEIIKEKYKEELHYG